MKEYIFYRYINENKYFLAHFSLSDKFSDNIELMERIEKLLAKVPNTERSDFVVAAEKDGELVNEVFFSNRLAILEIFTQINAIYIEAFKKFIAADELSIFERKEDITSNNFFDLSSIIGGKS